MRHDELIADAVEAQRREPDRVDGRGRLDGLGVRLRAGRGRGRARRHAALAAEPWPAGHRHRRALGHPHGRGRAARRATTSARPRPRGAPARARPTAARSSSPSVTSRARRRGTCPRAARSSTSGRTASRGSARRSAIYALAGPGVDAPLAGHRVPVPRPAGLRGRGPRASSSAAKRSWRSIVERLAPRPAARRRRRLGQRQVVGPARRRRRRRPRRRGRRDRRRRAHDARRRAALDVRRRARRGSWSSTSSRSCSRCATTRLAGARSSTRCWRCAGAVVIGVRADIYGRLEHARRLARAVAANQILLGAMTDDELERAVTEPARLAGLRLEPGLVDLVLRDVAGEPGALPLLSHALRATWERRDGRTLTVEGYRESGGVASAIARTADAVVDALPDDAASVDAWRVPADDRARRGHRGHAAARDDRGARARGGARRTSVDGLLERLADARLVTLDEGTARGRARGADPRVAAAAGWLDEDRAGSACTAELGRRRPAVGRRRPRALRPLPRRPAGRRASSSRGRAELNATERAFLDASVAEAGRERRASGGPTAACAACWPGAVRPARASRSPPAC